MALNKQHLKRFGDIAKLFMKYGRSDVVRQFGLLEALDENEVVEDRDPARPEELVNDLEKMGPTYVKLGQILSSRPDLMPARYLKALARLQDRVAPFPYEDVERIVHAELGARISKAFASFDREPIAAASLGQAHRATLRDGREVVVKVQRPNIRSQVAQDLEVLEEIAGFFAEHTKMGKRYQFLELFEEFKLTLIHELDYQREAANMIAVAKNLQSFAKIYIPLPIQGYTTRCVLTMEAVKGRKITEISPLARLDLDGKALGEELFRAYLKQVLLDGLFHADPHPGNVFLTDDGRIALLDLGMVGRTSTNMQDYILKLLIAFSEGKSEAAADIVIRESKTLNDFKEADFRRKVGQLVAELRDHSLKDLQIGKVLLEMGKKAGDNGLLVPSELTLLGKTLLQLDEVGRCLDPDFNPNAAIRRNVLEIMNERMWKNLTPGNIFGSILELKDFFGYLPSRLNKILDSVANSELEVKVRATDAHDILESFRNMANRITAGLILAAMIVGASLLMKVETSFTLFGYPGLAMLFFLIAATGGLYLVTNILLVDHKRKKKYK